MSQPSQPYRKAKGVIETIELTLTVPGPAYAAATTVCNSKSDREDSKAGAQNGQEPSSAVPLVASSISTALNFTPPAISMSIVSPDSFTPPSEPTVPQFTLPPTPLTTTISGIVPPTFIMSAAPPKNTANGCACQCLCPLGSFPNVPPGQPVQPIAQLPIPPSTGPSPPDTTSVSTFTSSASTDLSSQSNLSAGSPDLSYTVANGSTSTTELSSSVGDSTIIAPDPTDLLTNGSSTSTQPANTIPTPTALPLTNSPPQKGPAPPPPPFSIDTLSLTSQVTFKIGKPPSTATINAGG
ncbi:MAG: hypothetical protein M1840_007894 [Geoglossum simile]|nr:MAG: hypothetical protein M1840_007894 [Geoglossum simile]